MLVPMRNTMRLLATVWKYMSELRVAVTTTTAMRTMCRTPSAPERMVSNEYLMISG